MKLPNLSIRGGTVHNMHLTFVSVPKLEPKEALLLHHVTCQNTVKKEEEEEELVAGILAVSQYEEDRLQSC